MTRQTRDTVLNEVQQRLVQLGLPPAARQGVMVLIQEALTHDVPGASADPNFTVLIARTYYRTALRVAAALDSSSFSMLIMLFDLFVAHEQKRAISVTSLCIASGAASTTALRRIGQLEESGFVTRHEDGDDRRRNWVRPTPQALALIRSLVDEWANLLSA